MKAKPSPQHATHILYGPGEILSVRTLDSGTFVADVRFVDGTERTIRLAQQYWESDISSLVPTAHKKAKKSGSKPKGLSQREGRCRMNKLHHRRKRPVPYQPKKRRSPKRTRRVWDGNVTELDHYWAGLDNRQLHLAFSGGSAPAQQLAS